MIRILLLLIPVVLCGLIAADVIHYSYILICMLGILIGACLRRKPQPSLSIAEMCNPLQPTHMTVLHADYPYHVHVHLEPYAKSTLRDPIMAATDTAYSSLYKNVTDPSFA